MQKKILIVENEKTMRNLISSALIANKYDVIYAKNASNAYTMFFSRNPDIIIIDVGLSEINPIEMILTIREWAETPVIVVSAKASEQDKVDALDSGADDYIMKPFGMPEFLARVRTALRHAHNADATGLATEGNYSVKDLLIDFDKRKAFLNDCDAGLTKNEFRIVALLARHAGKTLTYDFLQNEIWGLIKKGDNQILRVNMANIRKKIEKDRSSPQYIFTEAGIGYRMIESDK